MPMPDRSWLVRFVLSFAIIGVSTLAASAQSAGSRAAETGWNALEAGDGDKAAAAFSLALGEQPRDPALLFGAGAAQHLLGRGTVAREFLRKALAVEPRLTPVVPLLGPIAYDLGHVTGAFWR